jgi:hypothetical protein
MFHSFKTLAAVEKCIATLRRSNLHPSFSKVNGMMKCIQKYTVSGQQTTARRALSKFTYSRAPRPILVVFPQFFRLREPAPWEP